VVRSWIVSAASSEANETRAALSVTNPKAFVGHTAAVVEVAAAPGGEFFATASHDGTARVWRREGGAFVSPAPAAAPAGGGKRRKAIKKGETSEFEAVAGTPSRRSCGDARDAALGAETVLSDHRGAVNCVGWASPDDAWTGGDDKTLKRWDVERGRCSQSFDAPRIVSSLAARADGGRILWCGGGDKKVHAWDPRAGQTTGGTTTFASHTVRFFFPVFFPFFSFFFKRPLVSFLRPATL
jgi:WD40 repeat protein